MHTLQIAESVLDGYKNEKLSEERINFLITQANEQLDFQQNSKRLITGQLLFHKRFLHYLLKKHQLLPE